MKQILESQTSKVTAIFDHVHTQSNFSFYTMYEHAKSQLNSFIHSWDTADYGVPWPKRTHSYLAMLT